MALIEELLHRRTDLSTFLIHLTRDRPDATARQNLLAMVGSGVIEARTAFGPAAPQEPYLAVGATQKAVCFTETPLEHAWMMLEHIDGRSVRFQPYGLALTKTTARKGGCNPVWYSDITPGRPWPITSVNAMIKDAVRRATTDGKVDPEALSEEPIFKVTPFFEQMGPTTYRRKEFWWEREWRHVGDFNLSFPSRIVAIFAPADDHEHLREELRQIHDAWGRRPILDPHWGLERMIAELAQISEEQIGPFPEAG
ncbi:abortive infection system antitoxin AbiGi family protein [Micromonospora sp. WMMD710]|uniref:abortive infection system antitoxin AbiGi family protein n=1 Tax=Micromonospora sp. WMMD710 TaxID=3016085 RepID=UPI00241680C0|nr:abortive infection system antitoxin AbiGi family protein [Micromonospora sp. WMMD710]MDG4760317.1 abortive infection system antitoxin AbiGi family protein [Micromonospora sp. WMMD710]